VRYVLHRILATLPVMAVVAVFVFSLLHLSPGDPAAIIAGEFASPAEIARVRVSLGLDQPLHTQFLVWVTRLAQGDFGTSIFSDIPVTRMILQRVEPTLSLTFLSMLITISVAVPLGAIAAWKANSIIDRLVMALAVFGFSFPVFVIGYLLMFPFAIWTDLLPVQGYVSLFEDPARWLRHLVLPSISVSLVFIALIARMTRASMLEVLSQDYVRTAHAKGLPDSKVLFKHALQNASVPIVTAIGIGVALVIGGVVVTETVFAIPGLGRLTVDSILRRDYPVIQAIVLVFSFAYVLINLLIDLSYKLLDPRIRY